MLRESGLFAHDAIYLSGLHEIYNEGERYKLAFRYIKLSTEIYTKSTDLVGQASSTSHLM